MFPDVFQGCVKCLLRRGGRQYRDHVLSPQCIFSTGIFWLAHNFSLHPLAFSLKRQVLAAIITTADQIAPNPKKIYSPVSPPICAIQSTAPGSVVSTVILTNGSPHDIFSNNFVDGVSLNERQINIQCFGILVRWWFWCLVVLSQFAEYKHREGILCDDGRFLVGSYCGGQRQRCGIRVMTNNFRRRVGGLHMQRPPGLRYFCQFWWQPCMPVLYWGMLFRCRLEVFG